MHPNPYDPWKRSDLTRNERVVLEITDKLLHGDDLSLIEKYISPNYVQHTAGIGQGREGLTNYLREIAWKRDGRREWRPIHLFASGDFVILHKLLKAVVIADFFRFDPDGMLAEHWDVVQPLPEPDYDPMRPSTENLERFRVLFGIKPD